MSAGPWLPSAAAAGARSATPPERYERERLHELVDGAAERYLEHGVERCAAATYAFPGAAGLEIAAEVYRFRDGAGAQAQAEAERTSAEAPVQELPGTSTDGQVLHAVAGRQLLKLTVLSPAPGGRERLLALAAAWRKDLP